MQLCIGDTPLNGPASAPWRADLQLVYVGDPPDSLRFGGVDVPVGPSPIRLPALSAELVARRGGELLRQRVEVEPDRRPPPEDADLLAAWARLASELCPTGAAVGSAFQVPILAIEALLARFESTPVDTLLRRRGRAAIGAIASSPRSYLRTEDAHVPVDRVQRVSRDAERELSRSGQALMVGRRAVPSQLLATFVEEELAIYENRVLISLVRRLQYRARRRLRDLTDAERRIGQLQSGLDRLHRLHQFRRHGALKVASEPRSQPGWIDDLTEKIEELRESLKGQLRTFDAALSTPLGLALRRDAPIRAELRETNILTFDPNYSLLPQIWRLVDQEDRPCIDIRKDDPEATYTDFCWVALNRSIHELGFCPQTPLSPLGLSVSGDISSTGLVWLGPAQVDQGCWLATLSRGQDVSGNWIDIDIDWWPDPPARQSTDVKVRLVEERRGKKATRPKPKPTHGLRLRPTWSPSMDAQPKSLETVEGRDRQVVWIHPCDRLPEGGSEALSRFNLHTHPRERASPMSLALHPADWASADRMGRLLRRHTLWNDLVEGRLPSTCPCCGSAARAEKKDYRCMNEDCGTRWGTRTCITCKGTIPKVLPPTPRPDVIEELIFDHYKEGQKRQLFAEIGGRDMLADWPVTEGLDGDCGDMLSCPRCGD